ncbi:hypothetical protein MRBLMR1_001169 [Neorhizobium sp. LMR1-1-1.1]
MSSHKKFILSSLAWVVGFFALGLLGLGETAQVSAGLAVGTYLCPFGGLWCTAIASYY